MLLYIQVSQNLYDKVGYAANLKELVTIACNAGRLDWIKFTDVNPLSCEWGYGIFEVDRAGRMVLVNSFWDTSD